MPSTRMTAMRRLNILRGLLVAALFAAVAIVGGSADETSSTCPIDFSVTNGRIHANGEDFHLKGVNWFGLETSDNMPHGLWSVSMTSLLDIVADNGFNALRIPLAIDTVLEPAHPTSLNTWANPDLVGLDNLQILDVLVEESAARGILIMLDQHRLQAAGEITELWYDEAITEEDSVAFWTKLSERYCGAWNVFAADLKNEPHGEASWGTTSSATDWNKAAERIGNAVLEQCPRWLIFVEGVQTNVQGVEDQENHWWGGNLEGIESHPVVLSDMTKLVYSPHVYGPDVYDQPYFSDPEYPENLPEIWERHFGYVPGATGQAVVIGEWGGHYVQDTPDREWQDRVATYFAEQGIDSFYWCLNPNSGDTGGLLTNDWATLETDKLAMLERFAHTDVLALAQSSSSSGTCGEEETPEPPTCVQCADVLPTCDGGCDDDETCVITAQTCSTCATATCESTPLEIGDKEYCEENLCSYGEGDCDNKDTMGCDASKGLICGKNNGADFGFGEKDEACICDDDFAWDAGQETCVSTLANGDKEYCEYNLCSYGEGDCDNDKDTMGCDASKGLVCGKNNGADFGFAEKDEFCICEDDFAWDAELETCVIKNGDAEYCEHRLCSYGEGDCDNDKDTMGCDASKGLVCGKNNGADFGFAEKDEFCICEDDFAWDAEIESCVSTLITAPPTPEPVVDEGYCNWNSCNGDVQGGDWCNGNEDQCDQCGGQWCTGSTTVRRLRGFQQ